MNSSETLSNRESSNMDMILPLNKTRVVQCNEGEVPACVLLEQKPLILKNLIDHWPAVKNTTTSAEQSIEYLQSFCQNQTVAFYRAKSEIEGRYFYNDDMTGLNFETRKQSLAKLLETLKIDLNNRDAESLYMGSTSVDYCLPGFRQQNDLNFERLKDYNKESLEGHEITPLVSIWLGNQSRIACHYDVPSNIACNVVGKRRFSLFPPEQIANLYPGPIDFTPAGQAISMVDFATPDFDQFPNFALALKAGEVAELEPGDALFIPSMWWHHVEGLSQFNTLVNYWWRSEPVFMGQPMTALYHGLLSIRDLPASEKRAWKQIFDYYLFGDSNLPREHLSESCQGLLQPIDENRSRQLRTLLINRLNQ